MPGARLGVSGGLRPPRQSRPHLQSGLERSRRNPTLDIIFKLAHGLDVSPAELLATTN
ncbi:helix-turn-helix transcriptional regulator [Brevibacterium sp. HMSC063G07]|uniref:helix-turn-helix domain-containing protein n=1 Tax=Brevibacterium sp. HMSC063G07 TaxID=1739261 RepID=UPI00114CACDC